MANADEVLIVLRSIDISLKELVAIARVKRSNSPAPPVADDDRDLDSQYGDPEVRFDPRDWSGDSCKGLKFSACPAEFLDLLALAFDYLADKADKANEVTPKGKPVAEFKRKDAARARGWAARIRAGKVPAKPNGAADSEWGSGGF